MRQSKKFFDIIPPKKIPAVSTQPTVSTRGIGVGPKTPPFKTKVGKFPSFWQKKFFRKG